MLVVDFSDNTTTVLLDDDDGDGDGDDEDDPFSGHLLHCIDYDSRQLQTRHVWWPSGFLRGSWSV